LIKIIEKEQNKVPQRMKRRTVRERNQGCLC